MAGVSGILRLGVGLLALAIHAMGSVSVRDKHNLGGVSCSAFRPEIKACGDKYKAVSSECGSEMTPECCQKMQEVSDCFAATDCSLGGYMQSTHARTRAVLGHVKTLVARWTQCSCCSDVICTMGALLNAQDSNCDGDHLTADRREEIVAEAIRRKNLGECGRVALKKWEGLLTSQDCISAPGFTAESYKRSKVCGQDSACTSTLDIVANGLDELGLVHLGCIYNNTVDVSNVAKEVRASCLEVKGSNSCADNKQCAQVNMNFVIENLHYSFIHGAKEETLKAVTRERVAKAAGVSPEEVTVTCSPASVSHVPVIVNVAIETGDEPAVKQALTAGTAGDEIVAEIMEATMKIEKAFATGCGGLERKCKTSALVEGHNGPSTSSPATKPAQNSSGVADGENEEILYAPRQAVLCGMTLFASLIAF